MFKLAEHPGFSVLLRACEFLDCVQQSHLVGALEKSIENIWMTIM